MSDLSPIYAALQQADAAGDKAGAQQLADYIRAQSTPKVQNFDLVNGRQVPSGSAAAVNARSPVSDSDTQNFLAGAGKATVDLGRGAAQLGAGVADMVDPRTQTLGGLVTGSKPQSRVDEMRQAIADSRERDAALMQTGAGKTGFLTGNVVDAIPAAFVPGANTLAGSAALGAGLGLLQPSASTGETIGNVAGGAVTGPAALLGGRAAGALYQGGKAALEPLFQGGQQRVAARTLQAFAGSPEAAQQAATSVQNAPAMLPGIQPTTAELANNAGLAQLERTLRNNPEYLNALTERNQANRATMTGALQDLGGTDAQLNASQQARTAMTGRTYQQAGNAQIEGNDQLTQLLQRPSMQQALRRAQQLAAERGEPLVSGQDIPEHLANPSLDDGSGVTVPAQHQIFSGRGVQYLKMGLNDIADTAEQRGMGAHENAALTQTRGDLQRWITQNAPDLRQADEQYATLSQPINQMQVGRALQDRLIPALGDFGNNTRLTAGSYAQGLRNGDRLAAAATGQPGSTLADTLSPDQMRTVTQVAEQLGRRANADELGRAVGSNTGQNVVSQNVLRQFLGPLGLPQSVGERAAQNTLAQSVLRPLQFVGQLGEQRVMNILAQAALNPQTAARLLRQQPNSAAARVLWAHQSILPAVAQGVNQARLGSDATQ